MSLLVAERSILVVIDMQGKLMSLIDEADRVIESTLRLLRLAELFGVPGVLTEQYPEGLGPTQADLLAAFEAVGSDRRRIAKGTFSCCQEPAFGRALAELRPGPERQVVIAGIEAHVCVVQTVLELLEAGTETFVCWDCVSGRGADYRRHALARMEQAGAVITNHESVGFEWARTKDHRSFREMSRLFRGGQPS